MSDNIQLGQESAYPQMYDASLLQPIPRALARDAVLGELAMPFRGVDIWNAYELSWLNEKGKPVVAIAEFEFPAHSDNIVESKSFKYYLNSLNNTRFDSRHALISVLKRDLSNACGSEVTITLFNLNNFADIDKVQGYCVDELDVAIETYSADAKLLEVEDGTVERDRLYSHLLKSNCPVTGQPDWATVWIEYSGRKIDPASFLRYVVSYREHQDFHESCVEKIFVDIQTQCKTESLSVYARYTRRGGLDINPYRSNCDNKVPFGRLARQ